MTNPPHPEQLAAIILTKNEAKHIGDCIATLGFADRVIVSDSYSTDGTDEIFDNGWILRIIKCHDLARTKKQAAIVSADFLSG